MLALLDSLLLSKLPIELISSAIKRSAFGKIPAESRFVLKYCISLRTKTRRAIIFLHLYVFTELLSQL